MTAARVNDWLEACFPDWLKACLVILARDHLGSTWALHWLSAEALWLEAASKVRWLKASPLYWLGATSVEPPRC